MWVDRWFGDGFAVVEYFRSMSLGILAMIHPNFAPAPAVRAGQTSAEWQGCARLAEGGLGLKPCLGTVHSEFPKLQHSVA